MGSIITILGALAPLLSQIADIWTKALAANATNDQATLDAHHIQAVAMADALKPAGT